jgi:hypothetical protein
LSKVAEILAEICGDLIYYGFIALVLITATNATGCIETIMRTVIISHGSERSWSNLDKIAQFCLDELVLFRMRA